ncbi:hypothetical protein MVEN_01108600 [Mycena venus]|uniref:Uncharacterized protein n=1 Tax=Mycena venus TaxID=2733690 RepID=A0A8H6Y873_9AGAR|nr:hypothetical protein MVEN_01108600 [Mycena venus]
MMPSTWRYSCVSLVWTRDHYLSLPSIPSIPYPRPSCPPSSPSAGDAKTPQTSPSSTSKRRHPSAKSDITPPFSYLRIRKRSTEGPKKSSPPKEITVRRYGSADSFNALQNDELTKPLPPVPPLLNHNRGYSDPQLIYGAQVYPQVRSPTSHLPNSPNASGVSFPTPSTQPEKFAPQWNAPSMDNLLPMAHAMLPEPTPMMAAAAMISASQSQHDGMPHAGSGANPRAHSARHGVLATVQMDKAKIAAAVGPLITVGMQNLTKAQTVVDEVVASEAWSVVKENVTAVLAPAKDVVVILDSITKYIPALMVAESVFSVIIKHELERHENDKNILVVYHTMSIFWFTLCDLQAIFRADQDHIKNSLDNFFQGVGQTMQDFGNFREVYYRHGHFARSLRSSEYRNKLTSFRNAIRGP